jgi:hypothetical protein
MKSKKPDGKKNQPISDEIMGWGDVSIWLNLSYD